MQFLVIPDWTFIITHNIGTPDAWKCMGARMKMGSLDAKSLHVVLQTLHWLITSAGLSTCAREGEEGASQHVPVSKTVRI
jgi:hypothetical protein